MRLFDTWVQHLKYKVLRETAKYAWEGTLLENMTEIPKLVVKDGKPTMRCCIYKERAIVSERIKFAIGGKKDDDHVIGVIDIACDECPAAGFTVTDSCRGCIAHRCYAACSSNAITFDSEKHVAKIDKTKCKECGMCEKECPFSAIVNRKRPCQSACKMGAISFANNDAACIDYDKCNACGACVYQCPFGAITDKSYILDVIDILKSGKKVYALVAPAISGQFSYAKTGQVVTGIKKLGFSEVTEVALGADMVSKREAGELAEKGFLTSSCCPAFVDYVHTFFPALSDHVSTTLSPMAMIGRFLKRREPDCMTVFIGPCTAKKKEFQKEGVREYIDSVLTFEELQALFASRDIDLDELPETNLTDASSFARLFAYTGGVAGAVAQGLKETGYSHFDYDPIVCSGIDECKKALLLKTSGKLKHNFIEGMACTGGCVAGAGCLTHSKSNVEKINNFSKKSDFKTIREALDHLE